MDSERVKDRLLRLNKEIHDERFSDLDLSEVLGLWEQARMRYEADDLAGADRNIDQAYGILYSGSVKEVVDKQPVAAPVFVVCEEEPDLVENVSGWAMNFIKLSFKVMLSPYAVFEGIRSRKPANETLTYYLLFSLFAVLALFFNAFSEVGFSAEAVWLIIYGIIGGFILCVLASSATHLLVKYFGGREGLPVTSYVFGYSLSPAIAGLIVYIYLNMTTPYFTDSQQPGGTAGIAVSGSVWLLFSVWTVYLQSTGLALLHGLEKKKAVLSSAVVYLGFTALVSAAVYIAGATSLMYLSLDYLG